MRPVQVHVAERGNAFMVDIANWIVEAARETGRDAVLRADGSHPGGAGSIDLVVAPHEFYALSGWSDREIDDAARQSVPVCTEQPGTPWFELTAMFARRSEAVFDINLHGVHALRDLGIAAEHLRLGGVPSMCLSGAERTRDLLFLGGKTDRRSEMLADLAPLLWDRAVDLRLFTFSRPVRADAGGLVFGDRKYELLADSRILLNLHRDDTVPGYFEWARMVEAMANGCCVLTEPSAGYEPLVAGEHFIESDDIAVDLVELLDDAERCARIGSQAARAVLEDHPLVRSLAPLLDALDDRWAPATGRLVAPRFNARMVRAEQRPLLPAFRPTAAIRERIYEALMAETELQRSIERTRCLHRHGEDSHVVRVESDSYPTVSPEVSVVVTLFGYEHLVVETLDSIAASRDITFEIVVVDDHSLDDGRRVVSDWIGDHPEVPTLLLGSDINRGLPASRNLGFEAARADHVMVMDADNLVYPTALRQLSDALDADPTAAFAYSALEEFGISAGVRSAMGWYVPWLCEGNYIDAQAMIRRSTWEALGRYRIDDRLVFGWEDWEFWLRVAANGGHGVHVPRMLGRYRTQQQSMLSTTNLVADHMLRHLREMYPALPWAPWL